MFNFFKSKKQKTIENPMEEVKNDKNLDMSDFEGGTRTQQQAWEEMVATQFQRQTMAAVIRRLGTTDSKVDTLDNIGLIKPGFMPATVNAPVLVMDWYNAQGFLSYQFCAILSQHWLISKSCSMPGRDALRKGYDITVNDGSEIKPEILSEMKKLNKKYKLHHNLLEFSRLGRIFGIRIMMFKFRDPNTGMAMEDMDPDYYLKPFNIDGVLPNSYVGMSQIDPYWITPELDSAALSDPSNIHFYEPTYWVINGKAIHRTHLVIAKTEEPPDILKPTYYYGGIPIPQRIYERVYSAERTANEAPLLALTKRTFTLKTDISKAVANEIKFRQRLSWMSELHNNYGTRVVDLDDEFNQLDTALGDLDGIINNQYHIVAAAAEVPITKLLGTQPSGLNATGEFDEASYHEMLEGIQEEWYNPVLARHFELLIKSEIIPKFNIPPFDIEIRWTPLDSLTSKEKAEINLIKAQADQIWGNLGAVGYQDVREKLIADPDSGYTGLPEEMENYEEEVSRILNEQPEETIPEENT